MNTDQKYMIQFEMDLSKIRHYVEIVLQNKRKNYPADEIINESFLKLVEKNKTYSFEDFKKICIDTILSYNTSESAVSYDDEGNSAYVKECEGEKLCKGCKEAVPVSLFHVAKRYPSGLIIYHARCKSCSNIRTNELLKKRLQNPEYREAYLNKMKDRQKKRYAVIKSNPKLWAHHSAALSKNAKIWDSLNPDKRTEINRNYKARKKQLKAA